VSAAAPAGVRSVTDSDPAQLSAAQRRALRTLKAFHCHRRPGGFGRAPNSVSLDVASSMIARGLCRQDYSARGGPALVLTGLGAAVLSVIQQRAQRRQH